MFWNRRDVLRTSGMAVLGAMVPGRSFGCDWDHCAAYDHVSIAGMGGIEDALKAARITMAIPDARVLVDAGHAYNEYGEKPLPFGHVATLRKARIDNEYVVPVTISVDPQALGEASVKRILLLTDGNEAPNVATFNFGPLAGAARITTRIRLLDCRNHTLVAVAELSDGRTIMNAVYMLSW